LTRVCGRRVSSFLDLDMPEAPITYRCIWWSVICTPARRLTWCYWD